MFAPEVLPLKHPSNRINIALCCFIFQYITPIYLLYKKTKKTCINFTESVNLININRSYVFFSLEAVQKLEWARVFKQPLTTYCIPTLSFRLSLTQRILLSVCLAQPPIFCQYIIILNFWYTIIMCIKINCTFVFKTKIIQIM